MRCFVMVLVILGLLTDARAAVDEKYPRYIKVFPRDGSSVMTGSCEPMDNWRRPRRIRCSFAQISIVPPDSKKIAESISRIEAMKGTDEGLRETAAACRGILTAVATEEGKAKLRTKGTERQRAFMLAIVDACTTSDVAKLSDLMIADEREVTARTCKVDTNLFELEFRYLNKDSWLSSNEPVGACDVINTVTLVRDSYFWNYRQMRSRGSKAKNQFCEAIEEGLSEMTWEPPTATEAGCQYIDLGR